MMRTRIASGIAAAALVVAAATGCSFSASVGGKTVSQSELERKSKEVLQPQVQVKLERVVCKGGLEAKVGATQQCVVEYDGKWQMLAVNATDDTGKFHVKTVPGIIPKPDWVK